MNKIKFLLIIEIKRCLWFRDSKW